MGGWMDGWMDECVSGWLAEQNRNIRTVVHVITQNFVS